MTPPGGRPTWLPPFHRVERTRTGSPQGAVPFVLLAQGWAWAWDPGAGLLRLPDRAHEEPGRLVFAADALTSDGTRVRYARYPGPRPTSPPPGLVVHDLRTGEPRLATGPELPSFEAGTDGPFLYVTPPERVAGGSFAAGRYEVADAPGAPLRALALTGHLAVNRDGAAAQSSPGRDALLTTHLRVPDGSMYVARTDLRTGTVHVHEDATLAGAVSWSPDGTRCLVTGENVPWVLDLGTGERTRVPTHPLGPDAVRQPGDVRPLAWLGADGLLVSRRDGRRLELGYQPLDGSARYPVLDLPVPGRAGDFLGLALAADVVHRSPGLVGLRGAAR